MGLREKYEKLLGALEKRIVSQESAGEELLQFEKEVILESLKSSKQRSRE
jgi:hypothetical protein